MRFIIKNQFQDDILIEPGANTQLIAKIGSPRPVGMRFEFGG